MQPIHLTDSHREPNNPRRGFELMKMAIAARGRSGSMQNASARCRIVNPEPASGARRSGDVVHLKRHATAREARKLSENASKTHNSCG
jgi:hypothetical protein